MLYADKQALETDLKVCLLAIRERELDFYTQNCRSIGTSAALLAGFAYAGLSSTSDFSEDTTEFSKGLFLTVTTCAMSLNIASMAAATWCSMLGPGLALRGPDGSMDRAVEGLALEYRVIFLLFAAGLLCFFFSALLLVIDEFEAVLSVVLAVLLLAYLRATHPNPSPNPGPNPNPNPGPNPNPIPIPIPIPIPSPSPSPNPNPNANP